MEDTETENDPMEQLLQRRKFLFLSPDLEPILNPSDVNKSLTKLIIINTKFADKIRKCKLGVGNSHKQTVLQHAANSHKQNKITVQNCCQLSQANLLDLPKVLPMADFRNLDHRGRPPWSRFLKSANSHKQARKT